jgi:hypothetical protein
MRDRPSVDRRHAVGTKNQVRNCILHTEKGVWISEFPMVLALQAYIKQVARQFNAVKITFGMYSPSLFDPTTN